jgi:hypothetical protein
VLILEAYPHKIDRHKAYPHQGLHAVAHLRVNSYPLRVCTGRRQRVPRALRLCQSCDSGEVEDLPQHWLRCSKYVLVRAQFGGISDGVVDTVVFSNGQDQATVVRAVVSVLQLRR